MFIIVYNNCCALATVDTKLLLLRLVCDEETVRELLLPVSGACSEWAGMASSQDQEDLPAVLQDGHHRYPATATWDRGPIISRHYDLL